MLKRLFSIWQHLNRLQLDRKMLGYRSFLFLKHMTQYFPAPWGSVLSVACSLANLYRVCLAMEQMFDFSLPAETSSGCHGLHRFFFSFVKILCQKCFRFCPGKSFVYLLILHWGIAPNSGLGPPLMSVDPYPCHCTSHMSNEYINKWIELCSHLYYYL